MQQLEEGRLGFHAAENAGRALIMVLKDTIVRGPASPQEALLVGSSFRQVAEESGNQGVE